MQDMNATASRLDPADAGDIALPSVLDHVAAEALYWALRDRLLARLPVTVDGSGTDRISTLCIQVLVAAATEAGSLGVPFHLVAPSQALRAALSDLGVTRHVTGEES